MFVISSLSSSFPSAIHSVTLPAGLPAKTSEFVLPTLQDAAQLLRKESDDLSSSYISSQFPTLMLSPSHTCYAHHFSNTPHSFMLASCTSNFFCLEFPSHIRFPTPPVCKEFFYSTFKTQLYKKVGEHILPYINEIVHAAPEAGI